MHEALTQRSSGSSRHAQGWGLSLLIHGLAAGVAALMLSDLKPAPQPEPFKWNVAMVEPPLPPMVQPADSQPKLAPPAKATPAPTPKESQPVERRATIVQAVPPPQPTSPPVPQRQEPVPPPMPVVAKPVETLVQHPSQSIGTQTSEPHSPPAEPVVSQTNTPADPAPSHPAPSMPTAPQVANRAASAPVEPATSAPAPQAVQKAAKEPPAELPSALIREASATASPAPSGSGRQQAKADFGWVGKALWDRVMNLKRYPHVARAKHLEGRVVVRVVVRGDGRLAKMDVAESSGHEILDMDALDVLRQAFPLTFDQPLTQPEVVVRIPITYTLQQ